MVKSSPVQSFVLVASIVIVIACAVGFGLLREPPSPPVSNNEATAQTSVAATAKQVAVAPPLESTLPLTPSVTGSEALSAFTQFKNELKNNIDYSSDEWCYYSQLSEATQNDGLYEDESWRLSRGYVSEETKDVYENYPTSTLSELTEQGDMAAFDALNTRIKLEARELGYQKTEQRLQDNWMQAAVAGSSVAYQWAASWHLSNAKFLWKKGDESKAKQEYITSLAYFTAAFERNDFGSASLLENHILKTVNLDFSEEEVAEIQRASQAILQQVDETRRARGLDPLDNSVPKFRRRYDQLVFTGQLLDETNPWLMSVAPEPDHCTQTMKRHIQLVRGIGSESVAADNPQYQ